MLPNSDQVNNFLSHLDQKDWFCDAELDSKNNLVVYVDRMDLNFISSVPQKIDNYHILFHFACSQSDKIQSSNKKSQKLFSTPNRYNKLLLKDIGEYEELKEKALKLDLEQFSNIDACVLRDIFYEVHDGEDAVTDFSAKLPKVRIKMEELYHHYGFKMLNDVIG